MEGLHMESLQMIDALYDNRNTQTQAKGRLLLHKHARKYRQGSERRITEGQLNQRGHFVVVKMSAATSEYYQNHRQREDTLRVDERWRILYILTRPHGSDDLSDEVKQGRQYRKFFALEGAVKQYYVNVSGRRRRRFRFDETQTTVKHFFLHKVEDAVDANSTIGQQHLSAIYTRVRQELLQRADAWKVWLVGTSPSEQNRVLPVLDHVRAPETPGGLPRSLWQSFKTMDNIQDHPSITRRSQARPFLARQSTFRLGREEGGGLARVFEFRNGRWTINL